MAAKGLFRKTFFRQICQIVCILCLQGHLSFWQVQKKNIILYRYAGALTEVFVMLMLGTIPTKLKKQ